MFLFYVLFLLNLLGLHWLIQLYRFQVYNSIIHHPYIALCVHTESQVSFHHHLLPPYPVPLPLPPFPLVIAIQLSVSEGYSFCFCFCSIPSPISPSPPTPPPL